MPTDQQHAEYIKLLNDIHLAAKGRENEDKIYQISATQPYTVDYRERYHIWMWSANSLTLTVEDLGTFAVSANAWANISFVTGMKLYAQGQVNPVPVLIRCTDQGSY